VFWTSFSPLSSNTFTLKYTELCDLDRLIQYCTGVLHTQSLNLRSLFSPLRLRQHMSTSLPFDLSFPSGLSTLPQTISSPSGHIGECPLRALGTKKRQSRIPRSNPRTKERRPRNFVLLNLSRRWKNKSSGTILSSTTTHGIVSAVHFTTKQEMYAVPCATSQNMGTMT